MRRNVHADVGRVENQQRAVLVGTVAVDGWLAGRVPLMGASSGLDECLVDKLAVAVAGQQRRHSAIIITSNDCACGGRSRKKKEKKNKKSTNVNHPRTR
jgi:hypothetical protein